MVRTIKIGAIDGGHKRIGGASVDGCFEVLWGIPKFDVRKVLQTLRVLVLKPRVSSVLTGSRHVKQQEVAYLDDETSMHTTTS